MCGGDVRHSYYKRVRRYLREENLGNSEILMILIDL